MVPPSPSYSFLPLHSNPCPRSSAPSGITPWVFIQESVTDIKYFTFRDYRPQIFPSHIPPSWVYIFDDLSRILMISHFRPHSHYRIRSHLPENSVEESTHGGQRGSSSSNPPKPIQLEVDSSRPQNRRRLSDSWVYVQLQCQWSVTDYRNTCQWDKLFAIIKKATPFKRRRHG